MIIETENGRSVAIPETWEELKPQQIDRIFILVNKLMQNKISMVDFQVFVFYLLANLKRSWRTIAFEKLLSPEALEKKRENVFILAQMATEFMFRKNEDQIEFCYETLFNQKPKFFISGKYWFGPADLISDLTFGEFRAALTEMTEYFSEKNEDALLRMIACLYRPGTDLDPLENNGRKREPFNPAKLSKWAKKLKNLNQGTRLQILLWFTFCIHYIQNEDLIINGREINLSVLFPKADPDEQMKEKGLGWTGILYSISKEGVFGNIKATEEADLFDVLLYMYDSHLQTEKIKSK